MDHDPSVFERALDEAITTFGADSGTIHVRETGASALCLVASRGVPENVLAAVREVPWGKGMAGVAAERAAPLTYSNIQLSPATEIPPKARRSGTKGAIVVPMLCGHQVLGVIGIGCASERVFTAAEIAWLMRLGRKLAEGMGQDRLAA